MPDLLSLLGVGAGAGVAGFTGIHDHSTLAAKVISHWKLNEASGTRADSNSGTHDLTDSGSTGSRTAKIGDGADLAGSTQLYHADHADFTPAGAWAFTGWVLFDTLTASTQYTVLGKWGAAGQRSYRFARSSGNKWYIGISGDGTAETSKSRTDDPSTGTWYFFYVYYDGSNIGISINNDTAQTASYSSGTYNGTNQFQLGAQNGTLRMDGGLDSVTFWNTTLTSGELTDLYNSGNGLDW